MKAIENGLVVEDDEEWSEIFADTLSSEGLSVRTASNFSDARRQLSEMSFGVAFVDIRLTASEPDNRDGLRVLDLIDRLDDDTAAVVVTAEGDFRVARDALRMFNAFDAAEKHQVATTPGGLASLARRAFSAHQFRRTARTERLYNMLRGDMMGWDWDDTVQRAVKAQGGIATIYRFLDDLLADVTPALPRLQGESAVIDPKHGVVRGEYWSRATGNPVLVAFGADGRMEAFLSDKVRGAADTVVDANADKETYLEAHRLVDRVKGGLRGVVVSLSGRQRSDYIPQPEWT